MKQFVLVGALVGALGAGVATAQTPASAGQQGTTGTSGQMTQSDKGPSGRAPAGTVIGTVNLSHKVMANGQPLAPGTYRVRVTDDEPKPAAGETPNAERWVEFVKGGKVAGKEVASVIGPDEIGKIAKGPHPKTNASRVDVLKGGEYVRAWINKGGQNYLINLPLETKAKGN